MEKDLRKCKKCGVMKTRIQIGSFSYKMKKYADEHGKLWNGNECPECHKTRMRNNMLSMRHKRNVSTVISDEASELREGSSTSEKI